jgi:hypothetical protein
MQEKGLQIEKAHTQKDSFNRCDTIQKPDLDAIIQKLLVDHIYSLSTRRYVTASM